MNQIIGNVILFILKFFPVWLLLKLESIFARSTGKGIKENLSMEVKACIKLLKGTPKHFLDIGANEGGYTSEVLKHFPNANYFLFEPSPENVDKLRSKFRSDNIQVFDSALSDFIGETNLFSDFLGSGTASLTKREFPSSDVTFDLSTKVKVTRLDEFWEQYIKSDYIDYVKVDVEGHELDVLKGCGVKINQIDVIQFEFGGTHIDTRVFFRDFWNFFEENNFKLYRITDKNLIEINTYSLDLEVFQTTNYIAKNRLFI